MVLLLEERLSRGSVVVGDDILCSLLSGLSARKLVCLRERVRERE